MSLLSQFFEHRHTKDNKNSSGEKNQTIASIFSTPFEAPKITLDPKSRKKVLHEKDISPSDFEEDFSEEIEEKYEKLNKKNENEAEGKLSRRQKKAMLIEQNQEKTKGKKSTVGTSDKEDSSKNKEEPENLDSTIFVGNVPLTSTHKSIKKFFDQYGKIEKVWFRSIPVEQSKIPKKGLHIMKKYQEGADSMNAYVKFEKESDSIAACKANGTEIEGNNIRVTRCKEFDIDCETTVFIGNLPTKVKDQEVWEGFKGIGEIKSVRIIRNKETFEGIGIGYVKFSSKEEMKKAIEEMNGKEIGGRPIRVKKAVTKDRIEKKARKVLEKKKSKKEFAKVNSNGKGSNVRSVKLQQNEINLKHKKIEKLEKGGIAYEKKNNSRGPEERKPFFGKSNRDEPRSQNDDFRPKVAFQGIKKSLN